jgi:uncharacterized protein DUF4398
VRLNAWSRGAVVAGLASFSIACASSSTTARRPSAPRAVNLVPARQAVEEARKAGAAEHAAESFNAAQDTLQQAETLIAASPRKPDPDAQRLADIATAQAKGAASTARVAIELAELKRTATVGDRSLAARLKRAEEEQRRLEDRIELLQRDLEVTETELIRSKARLKGNETKAEASAAVAEAQILAGRLAQDRTKAATLARCRESLAKAEEQLGLGNYGAAIFFALKAQDTATRSTQETPR